MSEFKNKTKGFVALVVDDERRIRQALTDLIEDEGWSVLSAEEGTTALHIFARSEPDLVLLDIWMPGIDGIETLQRMKVLKPDVPVVIMSGHGTIDTAIRATRLGAFDYLEKPLCIDKIYPLLIHAERLRAVRESRRAAIAGLPEHP